MVNIPQKQCLTLTWPLSALGDIQVFFLIFFLFLLFINNAALRLYILLLLIMWEINGRKGDRKINHLSSLNHLLKNLYKHWLRSNSMPGILISTENIGMNEDQHLLPDAHCLSQWFSTERILPHRGHLARLETFLVGTTWGRLLLVLSRQGQRCC